MKTNNFKKQLFSFTMTSALVLSSLSGAITPMVHAEQKGIKDEVAVTSSKEGNNQSSQTSASEENVTDTTKATKKVEETTTSKSVETKSEKAVQKQTNTATSALQQATNTVNNLFYGNDENHPKPSNTNAQIDAARKQVTALPNSDQKTALLKKVEKAQQAYDKLMEQWKDVNETMDRFFVNGDIGNPKPDVTTDDLIMLSEKMFVFPLEEEFLEGYTMSELRKKRDQLNYVLNVTPLVKRLFVSGKPSPNNTQEEITYALGRVNEMYDGPYKQKLVEKIQEAQKAYNDAHIFVDPVADQAMEAVKQLFDGDTPKKDNTQEKIDEARKKVEAIKGFDTVKAGLLEKIKVAQTALDDKKQAITVDAYYYGNVYMTGQYSGNIKKFKLTVDGKEYTPGFKLLKNNRFELYIGKKITKGTKIVKVESFDETGKVTGTREITIQTPKLTVENYT
ncbi:toxin Cry1Ac domain D-VI-related protein, partial [Enterococcus ratti]